MPLLLGQLVYASFPAVGFKVLTSAQVPKQIQQAFIQLVVYQHWDAYNPPGSGYRAAYLHQVTSENSLFGWLYNDGLDDLGRNNVPYFICYYLAEQLHPDHLENIFTLLHRGPLALIDRQNPPETLETIVASDLFSYQPACVGVMIPSGVREHSLFALKQKKLLDILVPLNEPETIIQRDEHHKQQEAESPGKKSQITKTALLVGVSDYGAGFNSLPGVLKNVTAMQHVLQHPQIGGFASVKTLFNPDQQAMAEAIETLFCERQSDELVLLYFSGYGIQDDNGNLYLASSSFVKSSALPATFVQEIMNESRAQHQFVILDACWSSIVSDSDTHFVDIASQLGATGRVILTSTTSTFPYFQDSQSQSVYTRYLVEGMQTGAADLNNDGAILIHELHHYARRKVQTVLPVIQPQMYGTEHDQQITLAPAAIDDPNYQYRRTAERYVEGGKFSLVGRSILDVLRASLELEPEAATSIETEVLQPYRDYQAKLQRYVQELVEIIRQEAGWNDVARWRARQLQRLLGLLDEDVAALTAQISNQISALQAYQPATTPVGIEVPTVILTPQIRAKVNSLNSVRPLLFLSHRSFWLLVGVGMGMCLTAVVGVLSAYVQLKEIRNLKTKAKYEKCITKAEIESWAAETFLYKDTQGALNECRFEQARTLAANNKFSAAIKIAKKIPENSPLYPQARQFIEEWSEI